MFMKETKIYQYHEVVPNIGFSGKRHGMLLLGGANEA
jgi:hypothetical protein